MVFDLTQGSRSLSIFDIGMNEAKVRFPDLSPFSDQHDSWDPSWDKKCKLLMERTISS